MIPCEKTQLFMKKNNYNDIYNQNRTAMFNFDDVPGKFTNFIGIISWTVYSFILWMNIQISWVFLVKFIWSSTATISGYFILKLVGRAADDFYKDVKPVVKKYVQTKFKINGKRSKKTDNEKRA